jgi:hypothetical protein
MSLDEIALTESPTLRAQYADQVDALDKVKALRLLPDDAHATNVAELVVNGYRVIEGQELTDVKSVSSLFAVGGAA